ncbi:Golgi membrane protein 1 [Erpetoichthys calabaricus]|uniref:Golgi membrane protein 1 n=1 Tax=Erpetoichthys calabaricus TaxID=27687 RepID=A0A8C4RXK5_ERPCA|nr:Golgi membrane protein 1 [Erpetoichthys calabaricus]XP_028658237.1 Golgi membrane protein 1 [Erpetoichthys calabaricus]XP_028658238.1 Golgi membrane protein 1 [Erpetoichthys calabaricus]
MGGLGNGRRGGRSPPVLIGALIACLIVLGFNYWISNSRNVALQARIYELESKVRRAAAERGAVELKKNEFQGQLENQRDQISRIESLHHEQMDSARKTWEDEKALLQLNMSSSALMIQQAKDQYNNLLNDYGKLQVELQECQKNQNNLEKRLQNETLECNIRMNEISKEYEEKIQQQQKNSGSAGSKPPLVAQSEKKKQSSVNVTNQNLTPEGKISNSLSKQPDNPEKDDSKAKQNPEINNNVMEDENEIPENTKQKSNIEGAQSISTKPLQSVEDQEKLKVNENSIFKDELQNPGKVNEGTLTDTARLNEEHENDIIQTKGTEEEVQEEELIKNGLEIFDDSPDDMLFDGGKQNNNPDVEMDQQDNKADYNGDDDNVGEFEADKQAALAEHKDSEQRDETEQDHH